MTIARINVLLSKFACVCVCSTTPVRFHHSIFTSSTDFFILLSFLPSYINILITILLRFVVVQSLVNKEMKQKRCDGKKKKRNNNNNNINDRTTEHIHPPRVFIESYF